METMPEFWLGVWFGVKLALVGGLLIYLCQGLIRGVWWKLTHRKRDQGGGHD